MDAHSHVEKKVWVVCYPFPSLYVQWENLLPVVVYIPGIEWCVPVTDRDTSSPSPSCRTHTYVTGTQGRQRLKWLSACPPYELSVRHSEH